MIGLDSLQLQGYNGFLMTLRKPLFHTGRVEPSPLVGLTRTWYANPLSVMEAVSWAPPSLRDSSKP